MMAIIMINMMMMMVIIMINMMMMMAIIMINMMMMMIDNSSHSHRSLGETEDSAPDDLLLLARKLGTPGEDAVVENIDKNITTESEDSSDSVLSDYEVGHLVSSVNTSCVIY